MSCRLLFLGCICSVSVSSTEVSSPTSASIPAPESAISIAPNGNVESVSSSSGTMDAIASPIRNSGNIPTDSNSQILGSSASIIPSGTLSSLESTSSQVSDAETNPEATVADPAISLLDQSSLTSTGDSIQSLTGASMQASTEAGAGTTYINPSAINPVLSAGVGGGPALAGRQPGQVGPYPPPPGSNHAPGSGFQPHVPQPQQQPPQQALGAQGFQGGKGGKGGGKGGFGPGKGGFGPGFGGKGKGPSQMPLGGGAGFGGPKAGPGMGPPGAKTLPPGMGHQGTQFPPVFHPGKGKGQGKGQQHPPPSTPPPTPSATKGNKGKGKGQQQLPPIPKPPAPAGATPPGTPPPTPAFPAPKPAITAPTTPTYTSSDPWAAAKQADQDLMKALGPAQLPGQLAPGAAGAGGQQIPKAKQTIPPTPYGNLPFGGWGGALPPLPPGASPLPSAKGSGMPDKLTVSRAIASARFPDPTLPMPVNVPSPFHVKMLQQTQRNIESWARAARELARKAAQEITLAEALYGAGYDLMAEKHATTATYYAREAQDDLRKAEESAQVLQKQEREKEQSDQLKDLWDRDEKMRIRAEEMKREQEYRLRVKELQLKNQKPVVYVRGLFSSVFGGGDESTVYTAMGGYTDANTQCMCVTAGVIFILGTAACCYACLMCMLNQRRIKEEERLAMRAAVGGGGARAAPRNATRDAATSQNSANQPAQQDDDEGDAESSSRESSNPVGEAEGGSGSGGGSNNEGGGGGSDNEGGGGESAAPAPMRYYIGSGSSSASPSEEEGVSERVLGNGNGEEEDDFDQFNRKALAAAEQMDKAVERAAAVLSKSRLIDERIQREVVSSSRGGSGSEQTTILGSGNANLVEVDELLRRARVVREETSGSGRSSGRPGEEEKDSTIVQSKKDISIGRNKPPPGKEVDRGGMGSSSRGVEKTRLLVESSSDEEEQLGGRARGRR